MLLGCSRSSARHGTKSGVEFEVGPPTYSLPPKWGLRWGVGAVNTWVAKVRTPNPYPSPHFRAGEYVGAEAKVGLGLASAPTYSLPQKWT